VSDPLASAQDLAQLIGQALPTDLARMQMFLELASAAVRGYTGQELTTVTGDVVVFEPTWSQTLYLPERPVTAVTSVTVKAVSTTNYRLVDESRLIRGSDPNVATSESWNYGATVTYTHGWAEGTEQYKTIKTICLESAARAYTMNERGQSEVLGGTSGATVLESAGYAPEVFLTPYEKMRLDWFRPVAIG
jgi:hypothetical protein